MLLCCGADPAEGKVEETIQDAFAYLPACQYADCWVPPPDLGHSHVKRKSARSPRATGQPGADPLSEGVSKSGKPSGRRSVSCGCSSYMIIVLLFLNWINQVEQPESQSTLGLFSLNSTWAKQHFRTAV